MNFYKAAGSGMFVGKFISLATLVAFVIAGDERIGTAES